MLTCCLFSNTFSVGERDAQPGTLYQYDFLAFLNSPADGGRPVFVRIDRRIEHFWSAVHAENTRRQQNRQSSLTSAEIEAMFPPVRPDGFPEREAFPERFLQSRQYTDGFGRLLQTRAQAEDVRFGDPAFGSGVLPSRQGDPNVRIDVTGWQNADRQNPNVVVSGWQIYDNKGRVVEKYQPFFATGWGYASPTDNQQGQKATMFYDPRGQVIRTVNPDGSEQRVIYGTPSDLNDPDHFEPTPWETYTYDANDNAGRTHHDVSLSYRHHWNTPTSVRVDALGRTVETIERNRARPAIAAPLPPIEEYRTRSAYDIRGNLVAVYDALDRTAFRHVYDLGNTLLRLESIDAGVQRTVRDASGSVIEQRDDKSALILRAYDLLNRLMCVWARDNANGVLTLRERLEYGDGSNPNQPAAERAANQQANRLGKTHRHYDEAGLQTFEVYDFKENGQEKVRQVIGDAVIRAVFDPPPANWQVQAYRVDWEPPAGITMVEHAAALLDVVVYRTSLTYNALNRITTLRLPQDVAGQRRTLTPTYNRAGAMECVTLDGVTYVSHIAYNANGQRTLIAYGNGILTRYAYDPSTFRLARLRTERYNIPDPLTYRPVSAVLQDFAYEYDLSGNLLDLRDRTPSSGIPNTPLGVDALDRAFTYDPLYRLLSATGRECDTPAPAPPWDDTFRCRDVNRTRPYMEIYTYDPVGNLSHLGHQTDTGNLNRDIALVPNSNHLATLTVGPNVFDYAYDPSGNLIREATSRHFEWDHSNRLRVYRTQTPAAGVSPGDPRLAVPSVYAHYLYDASGQRMKKLVRQQGGQFEVTITIDGLFEYQRLASGEANNLLHVKDGQKRIAIVRVGATFPNDDTPAVKFHLGDHLGSSNIVVDAAGTPINCEEYTPYGESSFGSFARKRYRYTGKECDEESNLYYHGARYYAPWLARWISFDPAVTIEGPNGYIYVSNRPLKWIDSGGYAGEEVPELSVPNASTASDLETGTNILQNRAAGKAREYLWNITLQHHPEIEKLVSQTSWKNEFTLKSELLLGKRRIPDFGIQWKDQTGASLEVTSHTAAETPFKLEQLARDAEGIKLGRILGNRGQGYISGITEAIKVSSLPILGAGGNIPRASWLIEGEASSVLSQGIRKAPPTAGFLSVDLAKDTLKTGVGLAGLALTLAHGTPAGTTTLDPSDPHAWDSFMDETAKGVEWGLHHLGVDITYLDPMTGHKQVWKGKPFWDPIRQTLMEALWQLRRARP
jgi:RHS repeat-associated protein